MTALEHRPAVLRWTEPAGLAARGTVLLLPGRGESPDIYTRLGTRLAADAYRVTAVGDAAAAPDAVREQLRTLLAEPDPAAPVVLLGSDTGALFAVAELASGTLPGIAALVLAGLPTAERGVAAGSWDDELDARTTCPTHRGRLAGDALRRGALAEPVPAGWLAAADLSRVPVPVLALHGVDDPVSAVDAARGRYAGAPRTELVTVRGARHDVLNDQTHRSVAATIVLFLERLRAGADLAPIVRTEPSGADRG